jgi:predicted nucleic acid-binding protein
VIAVIDASAFVQVLLRRGGRDTLEAALESDGAYAPELLDAEVLSALARLERQGHLAAEQASRATRALARSPIVRVPHRGLVAEAWRRRANLSLYDAFYVALTARLGGTLLTTDRRLAASPGLGVPVTLLPR